ncbi:hypothetical protein F183_A23750 [Bryobacterales bacterium F-183]|nr:hypothetical protein F183_A23750 [Bryobacterales bacterium F-183]
MVRKWHYISFFLALTFAQTSGFALSVSLIPTAPSPQLVGNVITWNATSDAPEGARIRYKFTARLPGGPPLLIRDFNPDAFFFWTASAREGDYLIEATARNLDTGETATVLDRYTFTSRLLGGSTPVINATTNPQVFLFSAPACPSGQRMRVDFHADGFPSQSTNYQYCTGRYSMNFYIAGLQPSTNYTAHSVLDTGKTFENGPDVAFTAGAPANFVPSLELYRNDPGSTAYPVVLASNGYAVDLHGTPLWSSTATISLLTRPAGNGLFWGVLEQQELPIEYQLIRQFDLVGMTTLETNAEWVNEQLKAMGKRPISSFHHEVRSLPDGRIAALAAVEAQIDGRDMLGDMIVVFDQELNVVWVWDTFDWLDVNRKAVLDEDCVPFAGGCPPFFNTPQVEDWTHGNSLQLTPDGALLFSMRHQDWIVKINYDWSEGDGHVIWRMGPEGDFTFLGDDPYPWFSHQHDANFDWTDPARLIIFDNGNTRWQLQNEQGNSRGQVFRVDEANRTATYELNVDLGVLAAAVGSAQKLNREGYHFDAGYVIQPDNSLAAFTIGVDPQGAINYQAKTKGLIYRSFRMSDLYTQ